MSYGLTPKGAQTVRGLVSALCHGHNIENAATLAGLEDADSAKVMLYLLMKEAGVVPDVEFDD